MTKTKKAAEPAISALFIAFLVQAKSVVAGPLRAEIDVLLASQDVTKTDIETAEKSLEDPAFAQSLFVAPKPVPTKASDIENQHRVHAGGVADGRYYPSVSDYNPLVHPAQAKLYSPGDTIISIHGAGFTALKANEHYQHLPPHNVIAVISEPAEV